MQNGRIIMLLSVLISFLILTACEGGGGGSSGGASFPTASSISGVYTGGTSLAYFRFPRLLRSVFASSYSPPSTTKFSISFNANGNFSIDDDQGDTGGGVFSISGSSLSISSGTFYVNSNSCSQSTSSPSCIYSIKSGSNGLSIGSGTISGTLDFYDNTDTLAFTTNVGVTQLSLSSVSLTKLEGQSFTGTFGSSTNPNSSTYLFNCSTTSVLTGTITATVNGSSIEIPCTTWNTYPDGNDAGSNFVPNSGTAFEIVFCSSLGTNCSPTSISSLPVGSQSIVGAVNYKSLTVPSGSLGFYVVATDCPSGSCSGGGADVNGYITPYSGSGGGVTGKMFAQSNYSGICNNSSMPTYSGNFNIAVSTSGSTTGTFVYGDGLIPSSSTYQALNGSSCQTYYSYPISFTFFTSTSY